MTIKNFLDRLKENDDKFTNPDGLKLSETMEQCTEIWSNDACRGYLLAAAKQLKMQRKLIEAMIAELRFQFDTLSVDDAEKLYLNF